MQPQKQKNYSEAKENVIYDVINKVLPIKVIHRDREIQRILEILGKTDNGNAMLVGPNGCGKSAIVHGSVDLIKDMYAYDVMEVNPHPLFHMIQAKVQFDEKVINLFNTIQQSKSSILYIDNFDIFFKEYKGNELEFDLLLSMYLEKNLFKTIVNVTPEQYREFEGSYIMRFFEPVFVDELSEDQVVDVLQLNSNYYKEEYGIVLDKSILKKVVSLCDRFITSTNIPKSCFDILESTAAFVKAKNSIGFTDEQKEALELLRGEMDDLHNSKSKAVKDKDFLSAQIYKDKLANAETLYLQAIEKFRSELTDSNSVCEDDVRTVISQITKIPVNKLNSDSISKLKNLDIELKKHVINQDNAIDKLTQAIKRNSVGIRDQKKPVGVFLFVGPTGTGKTYLSKVLAENYFTSEKDIIRLDMSEYSDKIAINKLLGSSPGYIGYEEGGILTRAVQEKPHSIVLLDEIEKAHPLVFNTLLQVFDEGHMSDNKGKVISFKNNIIIMTSNVGCHTANQKIQINKVGFNKKLAELEKNDDFNKTVKEEIKKVFPPEFINRIDDIITFNKLETDNIKNIILLELKKIAIRMKENDYDIIFDDNIGNDIYEKNSDKVNLEYGAREVKRLLHNFENELTNAIIEEKIEKGNVKVSFSDNYQIINY